MSWPGEIFQGLARRQCDYKMHKAGKEAGMMMHDPVRLSELREHMVAATMLNRSRLTEEVVVVVFTAWVAERHAAPASRRTVCRAASFSFAVRCKYFAGVANYIVELRPGTAFAAQHVAVAGEQVGHGLNGA